MPAIPYLPQDDANACGAACLCMVYRSLGLDCEQPAVRAAVSRPGRGGRLRCWTHLLCRDALGRGLAAVVVQAAAPWEALRRCQDAALGVLLHHRWNGDGGAGHYSVLLRLEEDRILRHDPFEGPARAARREEWLACWAPAGEVVGHVLVAVAAPRRAPACASCNSLLPEETPCPLCRRGVPLRPGEALGCPRAGCPGRLWRACYCPWCDCRIEELGGEPWRLNPRRCWPS